MQPTATTTIPCNLPHLQGEVAFLLATDVAARGLDILGVETVVNFDCPTQLASYLHRCRSCVRACTVWLQSWLQQRVHQAADITAGRANATSAPATPLCCCCRVGRTARAGAKGRALTFIEDDDRQLLKEVRGSCLLC